MLLGRAGTCFAVALAVALGATAPAGAQIRLVPDRDRTWTYPLDTLLDREVLVRNDGVSAVTLEFEILGAAGGGRPNVILGHPQGPTIHLEPGEQRPIHVNGDFRMNYDARHWRPGSVRRLTTTVTVKPNQGPGAPTIASVRLSDRVRVVARDGERPPTNAVVGGRVTAGGRPVPGAEVALDAHTGGGGWRYDARADGRGRFRAPVRAHRQTRDGTLVPYIVSARTRGGGAGYASVIPRPGGRSSARVALHRPGGTRLRLQGSYDTGLGVYAAAAARNGRTFATTTFHNDNVPEAEVVRRAAVHYFTTDGNLLWRFPLRRQMPSIAVASDGGFVVTAHRRPDDREAVVVLDPSGAIAWEVITGDEGERPMLVALSRDDRLLAVGTNDGRFFLIDLPNRRVLWQAELHNQIRTAFFDDDGRRLYVDSGDGRFRAFDVADGRLAWEREVGSWVLSGAHDATHLLLGPKLGREVYLLRKSDGAVVWRRNVLGVPDQLVIAPSGRQFVVACSTTCAARSAMLAGAGRIAYDLGYPARAATFSRDGRTLVLTDGGSVLVADHRGRVRVRRTLKRGRIDGAGGYAWLSAAGDRLVIGSSQTGRVYFFSGAIG